MGGAGLGPADGRGAPHGIAPGGYRALESLRLEKGYRYFGTDLTATDTPFQSGLGFCVHLDKGEFNGSAALPPRAPPSPSGACAPSWWAARST